MKKYTCIYVGNHKPTDEQVGELREKFNCDEIITINPPPLTPDALKSTDEADRIVEEILARIAKGNQYYLWVQFPQVDLKLASLYAETRLLKHLSSAYLPYPYNKLRLIKAFILPMTERRVIEEKLENGQIKKSLFSNIKDLPLFWAKMEYPTISSGNLNKGGKNEACLDYTTNQHATQLLFIVGVEPFRNLKKAIPRSWL